MSVPCAPISSDPGFVGHYTMEPRLAIELLEGKLRNSRKLNFYLFVVIVIETALVLYFK